MSRIDGLWFLGFFVFLFLFSSCGSIYMPNVPATPMFRDQGEGYLSAHINTKGNISASAGIAVTDHIAIIANGATVNNGVNSNDHFNQKLGEGAIGYFTKIGKNKAQVLEFFAGYGIGKTREIDQRATVIGFEPVDTRIMDFNKFFVQANFSSISKKKFKLFGVKRELNYGTAIRLSKVGMTDFTINGLSTAKEENVFIEPLFFTRMEIFKGFQIQYTTGFNIGLIKNDYLKAGNSVFTLGLVYNFGKK